MKFIVNNIISYGINRFKDYLFVPRLAENPNFWRG